MKNFVSAYCLESFNYASLKQYFKVEYNETNGSDFSFIHFVRYKL
jgi:hypothetical protein